MFYFSGDLTLASEKPTTIVSGVLGTFVLSGGPVCVGCNHNPSVKADIIDRP